LINFINVKGRIYLVPVLLGGDDFRAVIPERVISITRELRFFIVENIRSARRYLRLIDKGFPIDSTTFFELNEHTGDDEIGHFLDPVISGSDLGIMSEAGMPGVADPGNKIISMAHRKGISVIPLSGPSSILMALISSGMNGQQFCFNGYLPVKQEERTAKLRELERKSRQGFSQIFIETPYRNDRLMESIITACNKDTLLCVAADITLPSESIVTKSISEWRKNRLPLNNRLVVFILQ
jgi:16S rRNA (cytidine1402-2'-O)-methyltransferase